MSVTKIKQETLQLANHDKRDVRTQFGALCWRQRDDEVQVLLVTSKRSHRWILPKGWPMHDVTPAQAALTEAWEEAGVVGNVKTICLGIFSYQKELSDDSNLPCVVAVFPVKVKALEKSWPEKEQRQRKWYSLKQAADLVDEPELSAILKNFDPSVL